MKQQNTILMQSPITHIEYNQFGQIGVNYDTHSCFNLSKNLYTVIADGAAIVKVKLKPKHFFSSTDQSITIDIYSKDNLIYPDQAIKHILTPHADLHYIPIKYLKEGDAVKFSCTDQVTSIEIDLFPFGQISINENEKIEDETDYKSKYLELKEKLKNILGELE
jgi:hypothetical protein